MQVRFVCSVSVWTSLANVYSPPPKLFCHQWKLMLNLHPSSEALLCIVGVKKQSPSDHSRIYQHRYHFMGDAKFFYKLIVSRLSEYLSNNIPSSCVVEVFQESQGISRCSFWATGIISVF